MSSPSTVSFRTRWLIRLVGPALGAAALTLSVALAAPALAAPHAASHALHAGYVSSDPAANAVVKTAPSVVTVHFAEPVDPSGSAITVYDAKGNAVSQPAQVDPNDLKTMHVQIAGDGSEVYLVYWHTVSATDGDPDVGAFSFFVNASGSSDLAPAGTTSTPAASAGSSTSTTSSGATPLWLTALIALVGLIVGGVAGVTWTRSRSRVEAADPSSGSR